MHAESKVQAAAFMAKAKSLLSASELAQFKTLVAQLKSIKRPNLAKGTAENQDIKETFERAVLIFGAPSSSRGGLAAEFKMFIPGYLQDSYVEFLREFENDSSSSKSTPTIPQLPPTLIPTLATVNNTVDENSREDIFVEETDDEEVEEGTQAQVCDGSSDNKEEEMMSLYEQQQQPPPTTTNNNKNKQSFDSNMIPSKLWEALFPFQREGVERVILAGGRMLVADEMGLGKTLTAIAVAAYYHKTDWPLLIVAPAGLRKVWEESVRRWIPSLLVEKRSLFAPLGSASGLCVVDEQNKIKPDAKVVITSYDSLDVLLTNRKQHNNSSTDDLFKMIICDESHYLKTASSQRTQLLMPLFHAARRVVLISGTPCLANTMELFTQLHALSPFRSPTAFAKRYGNNQHLEELHKRLQPYMLRRLKRDVLPEVLPPKQRKVILLASGDSKALNAVELSLNDGSGGGNRKNVEGSISNNSSGGGDKENKSGSKSCGSISGNSSTGDVDSNGDESAKNGKPGVCFPSSSSSASSSSSKSVTGQESDEWERASRELAKAMEGNKLSGKVLQLYMQAGVAKIRQVCYYMLRLCAADPANKLLVFGHHRQVLAGIQNCLQKTGIGHVLVDGQVTGTARASRLGQFQSDPNTRVAVLSLTAVGQGATLTAANHCIFAELSWTPGQLLQAEDRLHRLGQTRPTFVHYLLGAESLDRPLWSLLERKLAVSSQCLDNDNSASFSVVEE